MFNKDEKETTIESTTPHPDTVIGSTVKVEGNIECDDSILIDGKFVGTIETSKEITIGVDATVEGNIHAESVYLAGLVRGNISASNTIELHSTAKLYGDIDAETISIAKGATIQGECMTGKKPQQESEVVATHEQATAATSFSQ